MLLTILQQCLTQMGKRQFLHRDWINFQCLFNILLIFIMSLLTAGLWTCLREIYKLKQRTEDVYSKFPQLSITSNKGNFQDFKSPTYEALFYKATKLDAPFTEFHDRKIPHVQKRNAAISSKEIQDYCWTIYNNCNWGIPGESYAGPPGPPGVPGMKGPRGPKGEKGDRERGSPSWLSSPGENGIQGSHGHRGKRGLQGRPGKPGHDGMPGLKGAKGDLGDPGVIVNANGQNCTCQGVKGEKGARGLIGFIGYKGDKGEDGIKGEKGYGMQGFPGPRGPPGDKGDKGDSGSCKVSPSANCGDKYIRRTVDQDSPEALYPSQKGSTQKSSNLIAAADTNHSRRTQGVIIIQYLLIMHISDHCR